MCLTAVKLSTFWETRSEFCMKYCFCSIFYRNQKKSPHPTPSPKRMEDDSSESEDSIAAISASEDEVN